ncbi:50S ribosomal protein L25 [Mucisphaera sp.]|uniref:50S ribosomal protein L25 n=1 Tax=Mucisphaera sp. TaxID=2913024 RepID=UPI003D0B99D6
MSHEIPVIEAELRTHVGTRYAKRLRDSGKIPAVVYGHGEAPAHLAIDGALLLDAVKDHAHLIEVSYDGKTQAALIKDLQWDHLSRYLIHADLTRVDRSERVEVDVEIKFVGSPKSLEAAGAVLEQPLQALTVACRADAIPEMIEVSIADLTEETPVYASEAKLPDGVELITEGDTAVATISIAKAVEEEEDLPGGDEAEPEVITKAKEDEGGEE